MPQLRVQNVAALNLYDAAGRGAANDVESLLESGVDPNSRFDKFDLSGVDENWSSSDKSSQLPVIFPDETEWHALRLAAQDHQGGPYLPNKSQIEAVMTALLRHGADPYALFRQRILRYRGDSQFPTTTWDQASSDEDTEMMGVRIARVTVLKHAIQLERRRQRIAQGMPAHEVDDSSISDLDFKDAVSYEGRFPPAYGARSILHSMLEDGAFVQPILNFLGENLDLERRDPQGRTLFLAACRSELGLDAAIDGMKYDIQRLCDPPGIYHNPFPQPDNPWKELERQGDTTITPTTTPTLLQYFVSHGAELAAIDNYGRNALHHVLDGIDRFDVIMPPTITNSLRYLTTHCPSLLNQPDYAGFYPLHLALRRMGGYWNTNYVPKSVSSFETVIDDLLAAGAEPLVRDGRGHTALHYLADDLLGEIGSRGDKQRRLFQTFLDRGVDPNTRNVDGISALEIFLAKPEDDDRREGEDDPCRYEAIAREVIDMFERAGGRLKETNLEGQTLLHAVARQASMRALEWFEPLMDKGLDIMCRDNQGRTPVDIVRDNENLARNVNYLLDRATRK